MQKIKVTTPARSTLFDLTPDNLSYLCIEMAGGGHTVAQTTEAMIIRTQMESGEKVTKGKYTIEIVEV